MKWFIIFLIVVAMIQRNDFIACAILIGSSIFLGSLLERRGTFQKVRNYLNGHD